MQLTLAVLLASYLAGYASGAVIDETTCLEGYAWMRNAKDQSPCLVSAYLQATCQSGNWTMKALPAGVVYSAPSGAELTACACSQAAYNTISACSACQGGAWYAWAAYSSKCPSNLLSTDGWPSSVKIPSEIVIPPYALTDINQWSAGKFNVTEALTIAIGQANGTIPTPAQPTDNSNPSSSPPAGPIAGGVVGGVLGSLLLAGLVYMIFCRHKNPDGTNRISQALSRPQHAPLPSTVSDGTSQFPLMQQIHRTPSLEAALGGSSSTGLPPVSPFTPPPATPVPHLRSRSQDTTLPLHSPRPRPSDTSPLGFLNRLSNNRPSHMGRSQSQDTTSTYVRNEIPQADVLDIAAIRARAHPNNTHPEQIDPYMLPPAGDFVPPRGDVKVNLTQQQHVGGAGDDRLRRGVVDAMNDPSVTWGGSSHGHGSSHPQTSVYAPGQPYGNYSVVGRRPSQDTFSSQQGGTSDLGRYNSQMTHMTSSMSHNRQNSLPSSPAGPPTAYRGRAISPTGPGDYFPPGINYTPAPYEPHIDHHTAPDEPAPVYVPGQHSTPPPEKSVRSSAADTHASDQQTRSSLETRSDKPLKEKEKHPLPFLNPLPPSQRPPTWTDPYAKPQGVIGGDGGNGAAINDDGQPGGPADNGRSPYSRRTLGEVSDSSLIERLATAGGEGTSPTLASPIAAVKPNGPPEM